MRRKVDQELEKALYSILQRISYQHYFKWLLRGLAAGMLASACFLILSRFWPWAAVKTFCLLGSAVVLLLALTTAFFKRPDIWEAACRADACGLKERASTACELSGQDSDIARRQREDALRNLKALNVKEKIPFFTPIRETWVLAGTAVLLLLLVYLPNPMQEQVQKQEEIRKEIAVQEKKIEEAKKGLQEKEEKFPLEERAELIDLLEDLQKDLQEADRLEDALKALSRAQTQIQEEQAGGEFGDDIQELLMEMKENEASRELAEKMAAGDIEGSQKEFNSLMDKEGEMPGEGAEGEESVEEMLEKALDQIPAELAAALKNAANTTQNGEGGNGNPQSELNSAIGRMCSQAAGSMDASLAQAALQNARQGLLAAGSSNSSGQLASNQGGTGDSASGGSNESGEGGGSGQGTGGSGTGNTPGNNSGGQGAGSGPGAGMGSSAGNESQTGQSSSSFSSGDLNSPAMSMREYEKIFDPARIGLAGDASIVKGEAGEGPQQTFDTADPAVVNQALRPYQELVGHYSQMARESLDRSPIPAGMADVVRDYFSSLE